LSVVRASSPVTDSWELAAFEQASLVGEVADHEEWRQGAPVYKHRYRAGRVTGGWEQDDRSVAHDVERLAEGARIGGRCEGGVLPSCAGYVDPRAEEAAGLGGEP